MRYRQLNQRGVTILEVLVSIFVLLIGVTGVLALFPVGVRLSQLAADDVLSAMTAQNALAAVRAEPGLRERVKMYVASGEPSPNPNGDVLAWATDSKERGPEHISGGIVTLAAQSLQVNFDADTGRTLNTIKITGGVPDPTDNMAADDCALLLINSGKAAWKVYRLTSGSSLSGSVNSTKPETNFLIDNINASVGSGDECILVGARDKDGEYATVPKDFYNHSSVSPPYYLGRGAVEGYGYLAILTRLYGQEDTFRIDILVYKGYNRQLPPEGNLPAIACYATILSGDALQ
jgi:Tfp pilus assembly protein PilV